MHIPAVPCTVIQSLKEKKNESMSPERLKTIPKNLRALGGRKRDVSNGRHGQNSGFLRRVKKGPTAITGNYFAMYMKYI